MLNQKIYIVSHAPFWHDGSNVSDRYYHAMLAALPAVLFGFFQFGLPAVGVVCLSTSSAIFWEFVMNRLTRRAVTVGDGNAALVGLLFGMLLPATTPWWLVIIGTLVSMVIGKHIYGGIGANPFNPVLVGLAIVMLSWKNYFNFDQALLNYEFDFTALYPLGALKHFGTAAAAPFGAGDLLLGRQIGGIGTTFGLGLLMGGIYLIFKGFVRWEVSISFLLGIAITAQIFNAADAARFAGPGIHLFSGYTLIAAFFLLPEDSSSPVHFLPMLIYGAGAGILTVLIRNIGAYADGVVFAVLMMNILNPLLDKIRPKAIGKVV